MQVKIKRKKVVLCIFFIFFIIQLFGTPAFALNTGDNKITVTKMNDPQGFIEDFGLNPISSDVVDELSDIDHIEEIIPVIALSYGNIDRDRPPGNDFDSPPDWNTSIKLDSFI